MNPTEKKVDELGRTLTEMFNLVAAGRMTNEQDVSRIQTLSVKGESLQDELAKEFGVAITAPLETLQNILSVAEARKFGGTGSLKEAIEVLAKITPQIPDNTCPTPNGLQDATREALGDKKNKKPPQP